MHWDEPKFLCFVEDTVRMARGDLPGYGFRHVVFPYPPEDEPTCIERVRGEMVRRLEEKGFGAHVLAIAPFVARAVAKVASRDLRDMEEYASVQGDLSGDKMGLVSRIAPRCLEEVRKQPRRVDVAILCRLGALYPFAHVSTLLDAIHREDNKLTVAVAYPGTAEGMVLRFLGMADPTGGYRGHIVT